MDARYFFLIFLIPLIGVARSENEVEDIEDSETGGRQLRDWPWGKRKQFVCPSLFGTYADIFDCSAFYVCEGGIANRTTCNRGMWFHKYRKECVSFLIAICDDGKYACPSFAGKFPHPDDCSKYYNCNFFISSLKTCPGSELFDSDKKECSRAENVHCGSRKRPSGDDDPTTAHPTTKNDEEDKFTCPRILGDFEHPSDCSKYYSCVFYKRSLKACPESELFDGVKKKCRPGKDVHCGTRRRPSGDDDPTTAHPTTKNDEEDKFTCPRILGDFEHPSDCSKYYTCVFYRRSLKACPESELFDGVKKKCRPGKDVHCGTRRRPSDATTEEITTTPIFTETPTSTEPETTPTEPETTTPTEPETATPTEPETATPTEPETTTPTELETTTPTPTDPEPITTTEETTTTKRPKVTAPDTECDEDDVDCIIDDLGKTPDWFVCPEDIGSYPHPSSKKLFIFCLNWKPSVKKCRKDLAFSEDLMACVHLY